MSCIIFKGQFNPQKITGLYSEAVILKLCQTHDIPHDEHASNLFHTLEGAAQRYYSVAKNGTPKLTAPEIKKYLLNMSKALNMLTAKMEDMPEQVADAFYGTLHAIEEDRIQAATEGLDVDGRFVIDPAALQDALKELQLICDTALADLSPGKSGRPENSALYYWVLKVK